MRITKPHTPLDTTSSIVKHQALCQGLTGYAEI